MYLWNEWIILIQIGASMKQLRNRLLLELKYKREGVVGILHLSPSSLYLSIESIDWLTHRLAYPID